MYDIPKKTPYALPGATFPTSCTLRISAKISNFEQLLNLIQGAAAQGVMSPKRFLSAGPNWVGDAVLAIPALKAVRSNFPKAEITLLVRPWVAGYLLQRRSSTEFD
jgi:hypothetical protein